MNAPTVVWTPALAIEKRLELREIRAQRKKEFDAADKADKEREDLLEAYLLTIMNERGEKQIKTDLGVAFKSPQMRVTMTDRQAVIDFVMEKIVEAVNDYGISADDYAVAYYGEALKGAVFSVFNLFTNHVSKEVVKEMDDAGTPPPGINIDKFIACNVRKA